MCYLVTLGRLCGEHPRWSDGISGVRRAGSGGFRKRLEGLEVKIRYSFYIPVPQSLRQNFHQPLSIDVKSLVGGQ